MCPQIEMVRGNKLLAQLANKPEKVLGRESCIICNFFFFFYFFYFFFIFFFFFLYIGMYLIQEEEKIAANSKKIQIPKDSLSPT